MPKILMSFSLHLHCPRENKTSMDCEHFSTSTLCTSTSFFLHTLHGYFPCPLSEGIFFKLNHDAYYVVPEAFAPHMLKYLYNCITTNRILHKAHVTWMSTYGPPKYPSSSAFFSEALLPAFSGSEGTRVHHWIASEAITPAHGNVKKNRS